MSSDVILIASGWLGKPIYIGHDFDERFHGTVERKMQAPLVFSRLSWLIGVAMLIGCDATTIESNTSTSDERVVAGTVRLLVNFSGEQPNVNVEVPCSADSTVFQILERAQRMDDLKFGSQGAGGTAFVHSINEVMNKGGLGKNWIFRVNGQLAHESCGTFEVSPGDEIEWIFGEYKPEAD